MPANPNILLIHTDQHRFDCLGCTGNPDLQTPALDAIAREGVVYENSFCPYPVCTPSRYSLLSGLYVHQHLGRTNRATLPTGLPTAPRVLRDEAGYQTAAVGKMHFSPTYLDVGFDTLVLAEQDGPGRHDDDYHRWLRDQNLVDRIDLMDQVREFRNEAPQTYWDTFGAMTSDLDEDHHSTTWIAERALEQLDAWSDNGNLLMVGFIKPHHPFDPPAPWDAMYDPDTLTILPGWTEQCLQRDLKRNRGYFPHETLHEDALRRIMARYYGAISHIDHQVGRLVERLRARGLYNDTLIVMTSDHGEYLGFHHLLLKANHLYDPLARVPLIVRYPQGEHGGRRDPRLVSNVDVAPTLLLAAGCTPPPIMTGLPLNDPNRTRQAVFAEAGRGHEYMVRTQSHKLIVRADGQDLLFDMNRDRLEMQNLCSAPGLADTEQTLRQRLWEWLAFEAPSAPHLDWQAREIQAPNVSHHESDAWHESQRYFRRRMNEPT